MFRPDSYSVRMCCSMHAHVIRCPFPGAHGTCRATACIKPFFLFFCFEEVVVGTSGRLIGVALGLRWVGLGCVCAGVRSCRPIFPVLLTPLGLATGACMCWVFGARVRAWGFWLWLCLF